MAKHGVHPGETGAGDTSVDFEDGLRGGFEGGEGDLVGTGRRVERDGKVGE